MARARIEWNFDAFPEIRHSDEVKNLLQEGIDEIMSMVDTGVEEYGAAVEDVGERLHGAVWCINYEAMRDEHKNHTLARALGSLHL